VYAGILAKIVVSNLQIVSKSQQSKDTTGRMFGG